MADISSRKDDHLDLCATDAVRFRAKTTLLEDVQLMHQSLPELAEGDLDPGVELLGKRLRFPLIIAAMTGGTDRAALVNERLARLAERRGYGFGLGSQRAMQKRPDMGWSFKVREWAPDTLLLGNVGVVQARDFGPELVSDLARSVGADGMCVHMNPAMELIQSEGDRDFRGGLETMARLVKECAVPVVAKETGNGISPQTARKLYDAGIRHVDVSGAGGTSWVGVETLRAEKRQDGDGEADGTAGRAQLGELLWDWGVPTAASVGFCVDASLVTIATGGIRHGLDAARAVALGARAAGVARQAFMALEQGGESGADAFFARFEREFRAVMMLTGSRTVADLQAAPRFFMGELRHWRAM